MRIVFMNNFNRLAFFATKIATLTYSCASCAQKWLWCVLKFECCDERYNTTSSTFCACKYGTTTIEDIFTQINLLDNSSFSSYFDG